MTRTNIDLDDELVVTVMERYGLSTKRDAVNFALRRVAGPRLEPGFVLGLEGSGWSGDLDAMRSSRVDDATAR